MTRSPAAGAAAGLAALLLAGCATPGLYLQPPPTVVFLTDFGVKDDSVALCKGVMWSVAPQLRIVDLSHEVPPYDVRAAGRLIAGAASYYPAGTVFVAVVDPGVGSARKAIAALSKSGRLYVGPDNGLFAQVLAEEGLAEAREISNPMYMRPGRPSFTFHGRDIFAPAGAFLADHAPFDQIGPVVTLVPGEAVPPPRLEAGTLSGRVEFIETPYGNVITNIPAALAEPAGFAPGVELSVALGPAGGEKEYRMPFRGTFSDVGVGEPVALWSSRGFLTFAINQGSFAAEFAVEPGRAVRVVKARR